jgi:hypothetical protein
LADVAISSATIWKLRTMVFDCTSTPAPDSTAFRRASRLAFFSVSAGSPSTIAASPSTVTVLISAYAVPAASEARTKVR